VIATIEARVEVVVREERGAWAEVLCSNGWSAWVDGRRLIAVGAPGVPQPEPAPGPSLGGRSTPKLDVATLARLATPPMVGAVVLALGTLVSWTRGGFGSDNAFDVPVSFLWSKAASGGIKLGVILFLLGVAGGVVTSRPEIQRFRIAVGGLAALCVVVFMIQMQRFLSGSPFNITDVLGLGVLVTLAGAVALAVAPPRWPGRG
jgi:hypothetical protein